MIALSPARIALLAVAVAAMPVSGWAISVGDRLPAETHTAFWVDDLEDARKQVAGNPYLKLAMPEAGGIGEDARLAARLLGRLPVTQADPLGALWSELFPMAGMALEGAIDGAISVFNINAEEFTQTFSDSLAVYSTLYSLTMEDGEPIVEWDVVFAVEYRDEKRAEVDAFLEKALARVPEDARKRRVEYSGHEVYQITYYLDEQKLLPGDQPHGLPSAMIQEIPIIIEYAKVNNVLLLAEGRGEPLRRAVRALTSDTPEFRLATTNPHFRRASGALAEAPGHFNFFFDINRHRDEARNWPPAQDPWGGMLSLLGKGGALVARASIGPDGLQKDVAIATTDEQPGGLYTVLGAAPDHTLQSLELVPSDAESLGSISVDLPTVYAWIWEVMERLSRARAMHARAALDNIQSLTGISIADNLLAGGRGEMVSYNRPGADAGRLAAGIVLPIVSGAESIATMNRLLEQLSKPDAKILDLTSEPFEGLQLWETPATLANVGDTLHLAATSRGMVMASDGGELRELARRALQTPSEDVRQRPEMQRFLARVPREGLRGFALIPARAVIDDFERARASLAGTQLQDSLPSRTEVEEALGDSWWSLHSQTGVIQFRYRIDSPNPPAESTTP